MILPFICFDADDALRPDAQSCGSFLDGKMTLKYKNNIELCLIFDNRRKKNPFRLSIKKLCKIKENSLRRRRSRVRM